jgi:nitroreductase
LIINWRKSMDAIDAIQTRVTAPRLDSPGPSQEDLSLILRSGIRAPDHGRLTPWRFVVIEGSAREVLGDAMVELRKRTFPDATEESLESERAKARRAPTIIVVAAHVDSGSKVPEIEQLMAVGACAQNVWLAAHALGYGVMWKTGDAAYDPLLKKAIGLSENDHVVGFLYMGTAVAKGQVRPLELDQFVTRL